MKKAIYLVIISILTLISCSKNTGFTLQGNIEGLKSDTLLVYYQLPEHKLDTIFTENGKFNYTINPDTFTIFSLVFDSLDTYPIYADKGEMVEISGRIDSLEVKGKGENKKLQEILASLKDVRKDSLYIKVDSILQKETSSFTSIYLMEKYYAYDTLPNPKKIKELINGLNGIIRDTPYMMELLAKVEHLTKNENNRNIYSFQNQDRNGKAIKWTDIKQKYILLDFWASWNKESIETQDSLIPVLKALKKKNFLIISISLDLDKDAWLKASDRDTTQWLQACDFTGWNNKLVKEQNINTLPYNILLDTNKRVIERNIREKALIDKIKELIKQDEEKEKQRKEAERKRKEAERKRKRK